MFSKVCRQFLVVRHFTFSSLLLFIKIQLFIFFWYKKMNSKNILFCEFVMSFSRTDLFLRRNDVLKERKKNLFWQFCKVHVGLANVWFPLCDSLRKVQVILPSSSQYNITIVFQRRFNEFALRISTDFPMRYDIAFHQNWRGRNIERINNAR